MDNDISSPFKEMRDAAMAKAIELSKLTHEEFVEGLRKMAFDACQNGEGKYASWLDYAAGELEDSYEQNALKCALGVARLIHESPRDASPQPELCQECGWPKGQTKRRCVSCGTENDARPWESPQPATVTDEMVTAALTDWSQFYYRGVSLEPPQPPTHRERMKHAILAAVGPALARLEALEKMEQRAKDARADMKSRQNATNASEEGVQVALYAECVLNHILTGSDAEKDVEK